MPKPSAINSGRFLNRVALNEIVNAAAPDPYLILQDLFSFLPPERLQRFLRNFCDAALIEKFSWKEGSPGNLLLLTEKLELLMEACFLYMEMKKNGRTKTPGRRKENRIAGLPASEECSSAVAAISDFFAYASLPQWKLDLYQWTEAALSNYPITESADASAVLHFYQHTSALIWAAHRLIPCSRQ